MATLKIGDTVEIIEPKVRARRKASSMANIGIVTRVFNAGPHLILSVNFDGHQTGVAASIVQIIESVTEEPEIHYEA